MIDPLTQIEFECIVDSISAEVNGRWLARAQYRDLAFSILPSQRKRKRFMQRLTSPDGKAYRQFVYQRDNPDCGDGEPNAKDPLSRSPWPAMHQWLMVECTGREAHLGDERVLKTGDKAIVSLDVANILWSRGQARVVGW